MTYIPGFENPVGYITGVRQWQYEHGLLNSMVIDDYFWYPHEAVISEHKQTTYNINNDIQPHGYYAAKSEHSALLRYYQGKIITGTVALWGEIHEHEKGYRAEYAYPLTFDHCTDRLVNLDELRELYLEPPTEKTRAIAEERKRWILGKRKESTQSSPLASLTPPLAVYRQQVLDHCRQQAQAQARSWSQKQLGNIGRVFGYNTVGKPGKLPTLKARLWP